MKHDLASLANSAAASKTARPVSGLVFRSIHLAAWITWMTLSVEGQSSRSAEPLDVPRPIPWRSGAVDPIQAARPTAGEIADRVARLAQAPERHVIVQLDEPATSSVRAALATAGVTLLRSLGENAFFAALSPGGVDSAALASVSSLVRAEPIRTAHKLHPQFLGGAAPDHALVGTTAQGGPQVAAYVVLHPDVPLETEGKAVVARYGTVRDSIRLVNALVVELPLASLLGLASEDRVQWIEPPLPRMSEWNDGNRARIQANTAQAAPYNLTGSGVTVLVYDIGTALASHVDLIGRLTVRETPSMTTTHSTHVAGTIGGDGTASGGALRGMAPGVTMESFGLEGSASGIWLYTNPGDLQDDYDEAINSLGADIANNSIGTNIESSNENCDFQGDYGVTDQLIDDIVRGGLGAPFRVVWANGNERSDDDCNIEDHGDYYSMAPPATAKNHITVGSVYSNNDAVTPTSSFGPTDDGRMKPDVCSAGCQSPMSGDHGVTSCSDAIDNMSYTVMCGTSMASPTVCGAAALLMQDFRAAFPGPDMRNSTLKIFLAHTAVDLGNAGPDYQSGYGSVRIVSAIDFMRLGDFDESSVDQGGVDSFVVNVPASTPELKVSLAWDDFPGTPNVSPSLVNDLDLRVYDPSGNQAFPWTLDPQDPEAPALRATRNSIDNIEQVKVDNPIAGAWRIEVHGFIVPQGPQPFSVCASQGLARVLQVPSEYATIQAAVDEASDGDIVELAAITHHGVGNRNVLVQGKTITLRGTGGPANCTIDCEDEGAGLVISQAPSPGITVEGIRILNGNATAPLADFGGGIHCAASNLTVRNCIVESCESDLAGGGLYFDMDGASDRSLTVENCVIRGNATAQNGGGIFVTASDSSNGQVVVRNCFVFGNNCGAAGAGIHCLFGATNNDLTIQGCTIALNGIAGGSGQGGGVHVVSSVGSTGETSIRNSILWLNTAASGAQLGIENGTCTVGYCDVEGGTGGVSNSGATLTWGVGNITAIPQFVDGVTNFHITKFSPCVNKGDPAYVPLPGELDIDAGVRILQNRIEMGADERPSAALQQGGL